MKPSTRCSVDLIDFVDENNIQRKIECYEDNGLSEGILAIAHEFNITIPKKL
jgi:hypothetical protein